MIAYWASALGQGFVCDAIYVSYIWDQMFSLKHEGQILQIKTQDTHSALWVNNKWVFTVCTMQYSIHFHTEGISLFVWYLNLTENSAFQLMNLTCIHLF